MSHALSIAKLQKLYNSKGESQDRVTYDMLYKRLQYCVFIPCV